MSLNVVTVNCAFQMQTCQFVLATTVISVYKGGLLCLSSLRTLSFVMTGCVV